MEQITIKDLDIFCQDFAYDFITSECMDKEFRKLTCSDAQEVKERLANRLILDLQVWIEGKGVKIENYL